MENETSGKFFTKGWIMVAITFCVGIVTQGFGLYSFSMLSVPMAEMIGDATAVAYCFSIYALVIGFVSLVVGDIVAKVGLSWSLRISAVLFGGGFLVIGVMTELWQAYAAYVMLGAGSAFGGMIIMSGIPSNWFSKRRGIAIGITWCATLPGSYITTSLVSSATAAGSWQTAATTLGIVSIVVLVVASFLLVWRPQDIGLYPDGMTAEEASKNAVSAGAAKLVGLTRKQALKTSSFWLIAIAFALIGVGEQGPFQTMPTYMVSIGYDLTAAGTFMTFLAFSGCVGKLVAGVVIDKFGPRWCYTILNVFASCGILAILVAGDNQIVLYVAGFFFGAALSSAAVNFSAATSKYLGPKHFAQIYGIVFLGKPIMDAIGVPMVTEIATTSGWNIAWGICIAFMLVSALLNALAKKDKRVTAMEEEAAKELAS